MQIMSHMNKKIVAILGLAVCAIAIAAPKVGEARLNAYRTEYKDAVTPIKYVFANEDGSPCCSATPKGKAYLLNIMAPAPAELAYSPEIDKLFKEKFEIEIDSESLINTPGADYMVVTMSRPAEYNKKYIPCAGGMGENRAYLISVSGNKAVVINRRFGGCGQEYHVIRQGKTLGYEVTGGDESMKPIKIMVGENATVSQEGMTSKGKR
jgi:hypothetical protein